MDLLPRGVHTRESENAEVDAAAARGAWHVPVEAGAPPVSWQAGLLRWFRGTGLYVIAMLAVLAFSGSLLLSLQQLTDTRAALYGSRTTGSWVAFSAELEYRRFMDALARFGLGDPKMTRTEMIDRFDIFWSRIPLFLDGPDAERLRDARPVPPLVNDIMERLTKVEPSVMSLEHGDREGYYEISRAMDEFGPRLREILVTAEIDLKQDFRQEIIDSAYRQVFVSFAGVLASGGGIILLMFVQLRRIARLSEERRLASAEAAAANHAKSEFLARMTHELRTPLTAVIGYSELLHEEAAERGHSEMLVDLQRIGSAGNHLLAMINDTLDLAKIETGRAELYPEPVDIQRLALEVVDAVLPLIAKNGNRLEHDLEQTGHINVDPTKLRQILFNLLSNAAKFTENGKVKVYLRRYPEEDGDWIEIRVQDTGMGIAEEDRERIFKPFIQADDSTTRRHGGTGLGLAVARSFCELMGGSIDAESQRGRGSVFTVRLPVNAPVSRKVDDDIEQQSDDSESVRMASTGQ